MFVFKMHVFNNFIIVLSWKNKYIFLQLTLMDLGITVVFSPVLSTYEKVASALLLLILLLILIRITVVYEAITQGSN